MKTVEDNDFEVPDSLKNVLREYQKNGFLWLKTLKNNGFGGILADDIGLGKTLQTIAVLLAAKEEGKGGTSLVVSPSSLVYNWLEEFQKFAPDMKVVTITGNQEARQEKLADWKNTDGLITSYDLLKRDIHRRSTVYQESFHCCSKISKSNKEQDALCADRYPY